MSFLGATGLPIMLLLMMMTMTKFGQFLLAYTVTNGTNFESLAKLATVGMCLSIHTNFHRGTTDALEEILIEIRTDRQHHPRNEEEN